MDKLHKLKRKYSKSFDESLPTIVTVLISIILAVQLFIFFQ